MENYIITYTSGAHYIATEITEEDQDAVCECILSIIRCSDMTQLAPTGEWEKIPVYKQ